jgi:hypothetical protein
MTAQRSNSRENSLRLLNFAIIFPISIYDSIKPIKKYLSTLNYQPTNANLEKNPEKEKRPPKLLWNDSVQVITHRNCS